MMISLLSWLWWQFHGCIHVSNFSNGTLYICSVYFVSIIPWLKKKKKLKRYWLPWGFYRKSAIMIELSGSCSLSFYLVPDTDKTSGQRVAWHQTTGCPRGLPLRHSAHGTEVPEGCRETSFNFRCQSHANYFNMHDLLSCVVMTITSSLTLCLCLLI